MDKWTEQTGFFLLLFFKTVYLCVALAVLKHAHFVYYAGLHQRDVHALAPTYF